MFYVLFIVIFLIRCKKETSISKTQEARTTVEPDEIIMNEPVGTWKENTSTQSKTNCFIDQNIIKIQEFKSVEELYEIKVKLYGPRHNMLVGISFIKLNSRNNLISSLYISLTDGTLLAYSVLSMDSQFNEKDEFIPKIFDSINFSNQNDFLIIADSMDGQKRVYKVSIAESLIHTFRDKPVILSSNQNDFIFIPPFIPSMENIYWPDELKELKLFEKSQLSDQNYFMDFIVTDVSGRILSELGEPFSDIFLYPIFVCYKPIENKMYIQHLYRQI